MHPLDALFRPQSVAIIGASSDPTRVLQSMMGGAYQNFWQAAGNPFTPQAQQEGRQLLDQIFELFVQADTSLERSRGGLGIGLTLVRQLVDMHGGRVFARGRSLRRPGSPAWIAATSSPPAAWPRRFWRQPSCISSAPS